jgi:hypothetical protein
VKRTFQQFAKAQLAGAHFVGAQFLAARFFVACSALTLLGGLASQGIALAAPSMMSGSVAGVVRDSSGMPQIGIAVELLRADSSLAARVFTDGKGSYSIASVLPGKYALKAVGSNFIPTLKQNLRIRTNTIVNLTLNNLYDLMQFAPMQRTRARTDDDWAWTLRSAESRPLLRWQEDGSPIMVWDGSAETSSEAQRNSLNKRKMRVLASGGEKRFGVSGQRVAMAMQQDTSARRRVAMSAEAAPDSSGVIDAMIGFRQEMANSGLGSSSVQTLVAMTSDPQAGVGNQQGLEAVSLRTWESLQLLNSLEAEAGSDQVLARVGDGSQVMAALPFASLTLHRGQGALEYRLATARSADSGASESLPEAWLPMVSERDGMLRLEHGLHQELGWSTSAGPAEMHLVIYGDSIENPVIEGSGRLSANEEAGQWLLVDGASGLLRAAGPNYSTGGMLASVESRLPGHNRIKLSYASGDALVMQASTKPMDVASILQGARARHAQMYSMVLSGTAEGIGTRWRASYRWQPQSTVTEVAPFAVDASEPYLNVYIRQPIRVSGQGPNGMEIQVDLRNLLAEGYQPFLTSDGSHIYFAQAERSVCGGLAFTF